MAAVLGAFVSKLAFIMMGMAKDEVEMLLDVPGEITKLETTPGDLSSILADAERRRICSTAVERWVRELKDAMYDVDDILDLCLIMEGGGEDPTASAAAPKTKPRSWKKIPTKLFCFRNPVAAHEVGKKIQALNKRLSGIAERSSRFGFIIQQINSSANTTTATSLSNSNNSRMTGPSIIRSDVVGEKIEQDTKKIVDLLIKKVGVRVGSNQENVVVAAAITGVGGIGKATLARMVFNDSMVEENFDRRIWLSVNKEVNQTSVLQNVIAALGCSYDASMGDTALLEHLLKLAVRQKKFLLVMDDVWSESENVWSDVLRAALNDGAPGSRVLVTTRNDGVARKMKAQHLHRVQKLEEQDAWILLKNQVDLAELPDSICHLKHLRYLALSGLQKASSGSVASRAMLCSKHHQRELTLNFTSSLGDNREGEANISMEEQERIKQVLEVLGWTEWDWEQHVPAMPILEGLMIDNWSASEWERIHHVQQLKAYASGPEKGLDRFIYYTKEPYSFEVVMSDSTVTLTAESLRQLFGEQMWEVNINSLMNLRKQMQKQQCTEGRGKMLASETQKRAEENGIVQGRSGTHT
ncbi:hypothetical protein PR202_ga13055 [Eleusine coracana subsp. coracana]|uniref:Uncharacterized protein n=1 Tax=Eleusine coracana subsp. coracana TaxID=191504 RepID=A0AAV5CDN0_ELECO|nr:hypothetical protein PR202_ga13055 [Eleusine coracana subsp. coracana]